jgi:hypothetical protein
MQGDNTNSRREFLKRAGIGGAAIVGTLGLVEITEPHTPKSDDADVKVGKSRKKEILFQVSPTWEKYYASVK